MPKDVFVMRAPEPDPEWEWSRWLRATETSLGPTPLLLFVRDRFDAIEALLRDAVERRGDGEMCPWCKIVYWRTLPDRPGVIRNGHNEHCPAVLLLAEIDAAKASG